MRNRKLSSLTVFFPMLNDAKVIPYLVGRAYEVAAQVSKRFQVIVINDGSTDNSAEVLLMLQKNYPGLQVITHNTNLGYGATLRDGFLAAKTDYVFYTDGDGQYDPLELIKLVDRMGKGIDIVNGRQISRSDTWIRKLAGGTYNLLLHFIYPIPIEDIDCDFRLCRRKALRKIELNSSSGAICLEMVYKLALSGATFTEVDVNHYARPYGLSEYFKIKNIIHTLIQHWQLLQEFRGMTKKN